MDKCIDYYQSLAITTASLYESVMITSSQYETRRKVMGISL